MEGLRDDIKELLKDLMIDIDLSNKINSSDEINFDIIDDYEDYNNNILEIQNEKYFN